ncbi:hypothetical protein [Prosthecobacter sp.]|jgi:hypothetical protein|uniref:hypothetical protein n=1 Tax=Prosthecobacter sp. TaxID=1965333 RepID=UPI003784D1E2
MKLASTLIILTSLMVTSSLQAKWGRVPVMQQKPVNIAAKGPHSSVSIDSSSGIGQVDNLINAADVTSAASLSAGKSFFIINFGKPVMVSNSSLVNDGVEGKVALSASADKNGWAVLEEKVFSAADREINFKFAGIQAKFLKYEFVLSKGGSMQSLTVYGNQTDYGYALKQDPSGEKGKPMNFVGGLGGARLVYAAPKPVNGIDTAAAFNKFEFPESDEQYRTLIYDMGQVRVMSEFSSVHSESPVRFEVFAFDKLPEKEDWRGRLAFNPADFNISKPVVAYEDKIGTGHIKVKPQKPVKTRYLALRWEPDFNPPAFIIASTAITGLVTQVQGQQAFTAVVNGETVTVTVDPGPAVGAGTTEAQATVTVTTAAGQSVTYSGSGVTGVNVTATGIQIVTGSTPSAISNVAPAIATISVGTGGTLSAAPTPAGVLLGVPPPAVVGGATVSSIPPAGSSASVDTATAQVIAEALGTTTDAVNAAVSTIVETASAPGATAQSLVAAASNAITETSGTAPTTAVGSTGAATGAVSASTNTANNLSGVNPSPTGSITPGATANGGGTVISVTSP